MSTSPSTTPSKPRLIHVGRIMPHGGGIQYLLLRQKDPLTYVWYELGDLDETETTIFGPDPQEATRLAYKKWDSQLFQPLNCGFLYTLPERDEHGVNALFYQMGASIRSPTGVFFDEERGHNCFVDNASQQAIKFWKQLEQAGKL